MTFLAKSDIGQVRKSNQDNFAFRALGDHCGFAVVCDGMGGHNGGNVASEIAVAVIRDYLISAYDGQESAEEIRELISAAVQKANDAVYGKARKEESLKGMGTTMVLVFLCGDDVYVAHAGDSRAYLFRSGKLTRLTKDHSFVQEMVEHGQMTTAQAENHPYKNVITRALGNGEFIEIDWTSLKSAEGDCIMLCSDGLSNLVSDSEAEQILNEGFDENICGRLVDTANKNGGSDNITVVFVCR